MESNWYESNLGEVTAIDQNLLFQSLTAFAPNSSVDFESIFRFELCQYSPSSVMWSTQMHLSGKPHWLNLIINFLQQSPNSESAVLYWSLYGEYSFYKIREKKWLSCLIDTPKKPTKKILHILREKKGIKSSPKSQVKAEVKLAMNKGAPRKIWCHCNLCCRWCCYFHSIGNNSVCQKNQHCTDWRRYWYFTAGCNTTIRRTAFYNFSNRE